LRRETLLSAAFALWGLAIGISLASVWSRPAPAGQLPGYATLNNLDAHGPFRFIAGIIILSALLPFLLRPLARRLAEGAAWARNTVLIAPLVALWSALVTRLPLWTIVPSAAIITICVLFRKRDLAFTRRDIVLIPAFLALVTSLNDVLRSYGIDRTIVIAALIAFAIRLAVALIRSPLPPALAFIAAPLGIILQTSFFARDQRYFGWHVLAIAVITPFVLRIFLRNARRAIAVLVFITYPLSIAAYANAISMHTAEGKPRVNVFEDSHSLLPASEMLAGELPFRDVVPTHGLIEDGLLDTLVMKVQGATIGNSLKTRVALGMLNSIAVYLLALAITGSAEAALLALLLALMSNWLTLSFRLLPPIATLALMCASVRLRRVQLLRYAGLGTVICGATSIDFGAYTFFTFLVAIWRFPGSRRTALRAAAAGVAIGVVPLFGGFLLLGILDDFFRTTFVELLSLGPVYTMSMFTPPPGLAAVQNFPELLSTIFGSAEFLYIIWCIAVVFAGTSIIRRQPRRLEPMVLVAVWIAVVAISYAERHHLYFEMAVAPFVVSATWFALRRRTELAPAMILGLIIVSAPTSHFAVVGSIRDVRAPEPAWVEVREIPRARGALFLQHDAAALRGVRKYADLALAPDETWLDLTNRGIFYFLLRRDCPIREPEVAFFQRDERQREVIRSLESDPRIRAVLIPGPSGQYNVDHVPNQERVPLVWQYVQANFVPDFAEGDVVMWRRK
jgi:hypothetical protein